ncbi:MAG TPA: hypothetical protein VH678_30615 [Xanthobacteraceae bacterium]|jgi:hypothetical protein
MLGPWFGARPDRLLLNLLATSHRVATRLRTIGLGNKLVLTYDNTKMTDGVGAQLQRIYGIYSISRLLGVSYFHSPLGRVDNQGLSALEQNVDDPNFHHEFNDVFKIKSDVTLTNDFRSIDLREISMKTFDELIAMYHAETSNKRPYLLRLVLPYGIADLFPDCYKICKEISPFPTSVPNGRQLRVAIHVRRGDVSVDTDRILPNAYYISVAQDVVAVLEALMIDYIIELHTEVPSVDAEMCRLAEFGVLPNLTRCVNETAINCLEKLATADILIMSRSSFSYVAAILNRNGLILYYPFWHAAPSSWITVGPAGTLDRGRLRKTLKSVQPSMRGL